MIHEGLLLPAKNPSLAPILSQIHPVQTFPNIPKHSFKVHFNIILPSTLVYPKWSHSFGLYQLLKNKLLGFKGKRKGKVHPRRGHEGPEGEQMYNSTLSLTSVIHGVSDQRHAPVALLPGKKPRRGWVGPRGGLNGWGKYLPHQDSNSGPSSP